MESKTRNTYIDFLRGVAMLIVILGHTMTGVTENSTDSVLFHAVWSIQMPLFILISGYVNRYGFVPKKPAELVYLLMRRTRSYLVPWLVFTVIFNGLVLHKQEMGFRSLFRNMDRGYWFLITLWTISVVFQLARFFAAKLCNKTGLRIFLTGLFYLIGAALLGGLGMIAGFDFLCIKLTLYYMPFYFLGCLFGRFHDAIAEHFASGITVTVAIASVVWIIAIVKLDIYSLSDARITDIMLRVGVSLCGCVSLCGLLKAVRSSSLVYRGIKWVGNHSIEVYLLHYYFLSLIALDTKPEFHSARGIALVIVNYMATVLLVVIVARLLGSNRWLNLVLFGKQFKKSDGKKA